MTVESPPLPQASPTPPPAVRTSRRRGRARPGVSLLASGEALVWLTGGALSLAIAMILGLLALVIVQGAATFWPVPVVSVDLRSGQRVLGEVTRSETYSLTRQFAATLPEDLREPALARLGELDQIATQRRLFRIGNFEITQNHFTWVSEFAEAPASEKLPPWAIVAERVEWGRCLGELDRFVVRYLRVPSPDEQDLAALAQWIEVQSVAVAEDQRAALSEALAALQEEVARRRRENQRQFVSQATSEGNWSAVLADGSIVPLADLAETAEVSELQQAWSDPAEAWQHFLQSHPEVRQRYLRRRELERSEMGRANHAIEQARLRVRAAELSGGVAVLDKLEELRVLREQLRAQDAEWQAAEARWQLVPKQPSELNQRLTPLLQAAPMLRQAARAEFDRQQAELLSRATQLESELAAWPAEVRVAATAFLDQLARGAEETTGIQRGIQAINEDNDRFHLYLRTADNSPLAVPLAHIVRAYPANQLSRGGAWAVYGARWWEFLTDEPREANSEGGVFPAIFGTVAMTLIMSLAVVPFGVLAALYLREYARSGPIVSAVRISINNLAGVPSIVFGVFGLGFFCYLVGAYLDGGPRNAEITPWPPYLWYLGLLGLALLAVVAFLLGLQASVSGTERRGSWCARLSVGLWLAATLLLLILLFVNPYFDGWFADRLPNPTLGKGGLLWSSLTLALLTLPVVIVSTEEALSAVPNSMREGSYACGAGKWQTIRRIVLPQAMPGIMTGMILAMARGAGEVAPLMLVGAVKLAPDLPIDSAYPFVHPERSFMHLGFHIYDLGFQSQNSEAAKPMVFTTTLLLIALVATLNIAAVWLRARLRQRFRAGQF